MPVLKGPVRPEGPLLEISIGWSADAVQKQRLAMGPIPAVEIVMALLDTGAEITCVDVSVVQKLRLPFGGISFANLPAHGGVSLQTLHDASVTILHPSRSSQDHLVLSAISVLEVPLANLGYEAILGRDALDHCSFLYHGATRRFRLSYSEK